MQFVQLRLLPAVQVAQVVRVALETVDRHHLAQVVLVAPEMVGHLLAIHGIHLLVDQVAPEVVEQQLYQTPVVWHRAIQVYSHFALQVAFAQILQLLWLKLTMRHNTA